MIILTLILTLFNPEKIVANQDYLAQKIIIVDTPEEASIKLYQVNAGKNWYDFWKGELFEINLKDNIIKKIEIPTLKFEEEK